MDPGRERHKKQEKILAAAAQVFHERGYEQTTMLHLAAFLSVTKPFIYYYFESKERLLESLVDRAMAEALDSVGRGIAAGERPAQKLALLSCNYASYVLRNRALLSVYFREQRSFSEELQQRVAQFEKALEAQVRSVLEAGLDDGEFHDVNTQVAPPMILGMISMAFHWGAIAEAPEAREALCCYLADQVLRMAGFYGTLDVRGIAFERCHEQEVHGV